MPIPAEFAQTAQVAAGAQASIVLPAPAANVAYLITHIAGGLEVPGAAVAASDADLQILDGATVVFSWRVGISGATVETASYDTDLALLITPANAATIRFSRALAGILQEVLVRGSAL